MHDRAWFTRGLYVLLSTALLCAPLRVVHAQDVAPPAEEVVASPAEQVAAPQPAADAVAVPQPTDNRGQAQALFRACVSLLEAHLYADALRSCEQSYGLFPRVNTLNNIGVLLRALGRHREARDKFQLLLNTFPNAEAELTEQVRAFMREESAKVATLAVSGLPQVEGLVLRLNGAEVPVNVAAVHLEVDGGANTIDVQAPGYEEFHWRDNVRDGETIEVPVAMVRLPEPSGPTLWPLWVTIGVAVAAGIGVGIYYYDQSKQIENNATYTFSL